MERMALHIWTRLAEHRRIAAAGLAGLGTLAAINAVSSSGDVEPVLAASKDLPSGHVISASDVRTVKVARGKAPSHALSADDAIGMRTAGPMRSGELLTDYRLASSAALAGYGRDLVLTTVTVDSASASATVGAGDVIDVVATGDGEQQRARVVAKGAHVVAVHEHDRGLTLSIATTEKSALALADAALTGRFSVLTPPQMR
jgi:Flp pilus assembly protein CpaB